MGHVLKGGVVQQKVGGKTTQTPFSLLLILIGKLTILSSTLRSVSFTLEIFINKIDRQMETKPGGLYDSRFDVL